MVGGKSIYLHFEWQVGKKGSPFRLSATTRGDKTSWIPRGGKKVPMNDWYYSFIYKDSSNMFTLHVDATGSFIEKLNHEKTIELLTR